MGSMPIHLQPGFLEDCVKDQIQAMASMRNGMMVRWYDASVIGVCLAS